MLNFHSPIGRRIEQRLQQEKTIWLTTVDAQNTPQPRPVWFHWDGQTIMTYSQEDAAKLRHIARNRRVSLNFNTDAEGGDVSVLTGEAVVASEPPSSRRVSEYEEKYAAGIKGLGMTFAEMQKAYPVVLIITPQSLRGA